MGSILTAAEVAALAFAPGPAEPRLARALEILHEAMDASATFFVYGVNENFAHIAVAGELHLPPQALWVVNRELTSRGGGSLGFRTLGARVRQFGAVRQRRDLAWVAALVPSNNRSAQMILFHGAWARGLNAGQASLLQSATTALSILYGQWQAEGRADRSRAELDVLATVSRLVSASSELETTLADLARVVADVGGVDYVTIDAFDEDGSIGLRCVNYEPSPETRDRWKVNKDRHDPIRDEVLRTRKGVVLADAQKDERVSDAARRFFARSLIRSTASLPLIASDQVLGVLSLASTRPTDFAGKQGELLHALAGQVAVAIHGVRLYEGLHASREALMRSEARFRSLVQNASDLITVIDADTRVVYQSPSIERVLGRHPQDMATLRLIDITHPDDAGAVETFLADAMRNGGAAVSAAAARGEARLSDADGGWHFCEFAGTDQRHDPAVQGFVLNIRDVTERRELEEQLRRQALHDSLTGLVNRVCFLDRLGVALKRAPRRAGQVAVLFIDLDNFKSVNDGLGHSAGDEVLCQVAARLLESVRAGDTAARFGGDEFAVLIDEVATDDEVVSIAQRIVDRLRMPFVAEGHELYLGASVGIAFAEAGAAPPDALVQQADAAMYAAKTSGKGQWRRFEPGLQAAVIERIELLGDLQHAVERGQLVLHYQPMIDLDTSTGMGLEALVRWRHPNRGIIAPNDFIPLAEESGLIVEIGQWVLQEACRQVTEWERRYPLNRPLVLSVNVSPRQLQAATFAAMVARVLETTGFPADRLVLEITENVMVHDAVFAREVFDELRALGVRFAVDDFGTGYSSIGYLRQFPFDILKIDKSFVDLPHEGSERQEMVRAIVELARTLRLSIVAEGIEEFEQLSSLQSMHCDVGQGFLFSRPLQPQDAEDWIRKLADPASDVA